MDTAACQLPDQPGIHRSEEQFPGLSTPSGTGNMVQKPLDLRAGKIGVRNQAGFFTDGIPIAGRHQLIDGLGSAAALPYNCVGNRLSGFFVPDDRGLALIRNADGSHIRSRCVKLVQRSAGDFKRYIPDFIRVMFHPTGLRIDLSEFFLNRTADIPVMIKKNAAGTCSPLVQCHNVLHAFRFLSASLSRFFLTTETRITLYCTDISEKVKVLWYFCQLILFLFSACFLPLRR